MELFKPGKIGKLEIKNRIILAPMGVGRMADKGGCWNEKVVEYYAARARGGTGLITTMLVFVSQELEPFANDNLNVYLDSHLESLRRVCDTVHRDGAKISVQLTAGFGRVLFTLRQDPNKPPISASAVPCYFNPEKITRAITTTEAEDLAASFGRAAKRCKTAGADAFEMHGHEGYLMDQFMTGLWNKRTDKYGGSRENRLTFAREVIAGIRKEIGKDTPVIYRYGIDHHLEGGRTVEEALWIAGQLEAMGYDALHVDAGCYETHWYPHPTAYHEPGFMVDMAEKVKAVVKVPVITVGKLKHAALAEKVLKEGKADFIAIGRALLADADWPNKVKENKLEDIRPCVEDNYGCMGELSQGRATCCTVNPSCGHEKEWALTPAAGKTSLLVIGGGPAGMEAARVAALRGIKVSLWEKEGKLGGSLLPASTPAFKKDMLDYANYLAAQLKKLSVTVRLNKEANADDVLGFGADCVILATGAYQEEPTFAANGHQVLTTLDLLTNKPKVGKKVLVLGGGLIGCETAVYLSQQGHQVTLTSRRNRILDAVIHYDRDPLRNLMNDCKIEILTDTTLDCISESGIVLAHQGDKKTIKADTLVFSEGMHPRNKLEKTLAGKVKRLYPVGDCIEPRLLIDAVREGFQAARSL